MSEDTIKGLSTRLSDPDDNDIYFDTGDMRVLELDRRGDAGEWNPTGTITELQLLCEDGHAASVQLNVAEASALIFLLRKVVLEALDYQNKYHPVPLPEGVQAYTMGSFLDAVERGEIDFD